MAAAAVVQLQRARKAFLAERTALVPFHASLRERTPWAVVTPAFVLLNLAVFVLMVVGDGAVGDPETQLAWGASVGPRTTNGEWWRVATSLFVHGGFVALAINLACLAQIGLVVERLVGPVTFGGVYLAAGVLATLLQVSGAPMAVTAGATHAVLGIHGLAVASVLWTLRSAVRLPLVALRSMAPVTTVFLLYNLSELSSRSGMIALATGAVGGLVLARGIAEQKPPLRRIGMATAAALLLAVAAAVPVRGIADVRPELSRIIEVENTTTSAYQLAVDKFRKGRMSAEALAIVIDTTVVPELQAAQRRLSAVTGVPDQHQPLVTAAEEYLRLREQSWRQRAAALRKSSVPGLRDADKTERESLEAFRRLQPAD